MSKDTGIVKIHGKEYQTVAYRVGKFWEDHAMWSITTEIISATEHDVIMKASILTDGGRVVATGHAEEQRSASKINKTSALENCETSAIGRALAAFGKGGTEFCSADELVNALNQQGQKNTTKKQEYVESKLPDFTTEVDKCQNPNAVDIWMNNNADRIKKTLNELDRGKLRSHCKQIKEIMEEAEGNE